MKTATPCHCETHALRGGRKAWHGVLPALALLLMPKCPACVSAYVAALTGLSIPFATAADLRCTLIALCAIWLLAAAFIMIRRPVHVKQTSQRHPSLLV